MKQFLITLPKSKAEEFATFSLTSKIRVVLSWLEQSDFFDFSGGDRVVAICAIEDADLEAFKQSAFYQFVKK